MSPFRGRSSTSQEPPSSPPTPRSKSGRVMTYPPHREAPNSKKQNSPTAFICGQEWRLPLPQESEDYCSCFTGDPLLWSSPVSVAIDNCRPKKDTFSNQVYQQLDVKCKHQPDQRCAIKTASGTALLGDLTLKLECT